MFHPTSNPIFTDREDNAVLLKSVPIIQQPSLTNYCHLLLTKYLTQINSYSNNAKKRNHAKPNLLDMRAKSVCFRKVAIGQNLRIMPCYI